ncbi:hypothetical protein [Crenalkalicoccus roseus]|uniref:hypothetical protein n=1 Tax=Crenalkalicoccus roseus TaxID=1485588 RepID=UPI00107FFB85|nr:hypothetical protein [Crenalkalicoccus roseus]
MSIRKGVRRHAVLVVALLAPALPAQAQLARPGCPALAAWAEGFDRAARWRPNDLGGRDRFHPLFAAPRTAALFGKPVLSWTPEEAQALAPLLAECAEAARRGNRRETQAALNALRLQAAREVPTYLSALAEARAAAPRALAELGEAPASPPLLRLHAALAGIGTEEGAFARAGQAAGLLAGPAQAAARTLLGALRDLPEEEGRQALRPAAARLPALREAVRDGLVAEIARAEPSAAGLRALDRQAQQTAQDHAPVLGAEATRAVEAAIAARRAEIGAALRDGMLREVRAAPLSPEGAQALDRFRRQALPSQAAAIGAEGVQAVEAAIAARRAEIGAALRDGLLGTIARLPPDLSSLQMLRGMASQVPPHLLDLAGVEGVRAVQQAAEARRAALAGMVAERLAQEIAAVPPNAEAFGRLDRLAAEGVLRLLEPEGAGRVQEAAAARRRSVAEALLPAFRRELAALPQTEEGMAAIDDLLLPGIAAWPASAAAEKAQFAELAGAHRAVILAAIERAEAGPLRGRIYEGELLRIEFVDRSRVVVTPTGGVPAAGTYTEEGNRVFVTVNALSTVFSREGRRLVGGPLALRRVR